VIIPEKPAENFKLFPLVSTGEASMALRKAQQERRRLREALPILFKDRYLAHFVEGGAPLCRPGNATGEIRPDGLECLTTKGQHQRNFVAVPDSGK
jgi:hypothetical protein